MTTELKAKVGAKPLEWRDYKSGDYLAFHAQSPFGRYEVWKLDYKSPFKCEGPGINGTLTFGDNVEIAKDAAFSAYESLTLSMIEDRTSSNDVVEYAAIHAHTVRKAASREEENGEIILADELRNAMQFIEQVAETNTFVEAALKRIAEIANDRSMNLKSVRIQTLGFAKNALNKLEGFQK